MHCPLPAHEYLCSKRYKNTVMKNFESRDSQTLPNIRFCERSVLLPHRLTHIFSIFSLLIVSAAIPAISLISCTPETIEWASGGGDKDPEEKVDSAGFVFRIESHKAIRRLDLLIYEDAAEGQLVHHYCCRKDVEKEIELRLPTGRKRAVAIANSPKALNKKALSTYSSIKLIKYSFEDDNPDYPIMGAVGLSEEGPLELEPLLCSVVVKQIANNMDDYELFESPRVRLCNINATAELFGKSKYHPSELVDSKEWSELPYDIGMYPQYPDISLPCYPNDTEYDSFGPDMTCLEVQGFIKGIKRTFSFPIKGISRGSTIYASISINSESEADCEFKSD